MIKSLGLLGVAKTDKNRLSLKNLFISGIFGFIIGK